jgi:hypothetical protein
MAVRDPGTPGRNPFFAHGPDAELGDLDQGDGLDEDAFAALPGFTDASALWPGALGADPLGTLAALVDALQGAQPEATEHLVAAAHELVLAVKTVVDATEAVLAAQRVPARAADLLPDDADHDPFASDDPDPDEPATSPSPSRSSGVRRIDLA